MLLVEIIKLIIQHGSLMKSDIIKMITYKKEKSSPLMVKARSMSHLHKPSHSFYQLSLVGKLSFFDRVMSVAASD